MDSATHKRLRGDEDAPAPRVCVLLNLTSEFDRDVLRGVLRYANALTDWQLLVQRWCKDMSDDEWAECDALIVRGADHPIYRSHSAVLSRCVSVTGRPTGAAARVWTDDRALGAVAAGHLLSLGHARFVFVGARSNSVFRAREEGFRAAIEARRKKSVAVEEAFPDATGEDPEVWTQRISLLLKRTPRPLAVCVATPVDGRTVLNVCLALGLNVPHDVAVVSCEDESLVAESCRPALSGVDVRGEAIGYSAAERIEAILDAPDTTESGALVTVAPGAVVTRGSSDAVAVVEPCVVKALRYIQAHALEPVSVDAIARAVGMAKRTLERAFRRELGRTPRQELIRIRVRRAHDLLMQTDWSVSRIAKRCGYSSTMHFVTHFRREYRLSPEIGRASCRERV